MLHSCLLIRIHKTEGELKQDGAFLKAFEEFLSYFDTGIDGVCLEKIDSDNIDIPRPILSKIKEELLNKNSENVRASLITKGNTTYFLS